MTIADILRQIRKRRIGDVVELASLAKSLEELEANKAVIREGVIAALKEGLIEPVYRPILTKESWTPKLSKFADLEPERIEVAFLRLPDRDHQDPS